ncbi:putative cytochrome P450 120 isoform X1 [Sardina pilchardus]|uniref:putative cytochrome P450 120 isoform X1 n=1 Tax=Sardina pilchardus TaxID=27697 RepID=UPI002E110394
MSKLPGSTGISLLGDKSLEFYRDPITFCERRIEKHGSRIFQARLLNKSTSFVCSVQGMKELLCDKSSVFLKDPTDVMTYMYGDNIVTTNGEEASLLRLSLMNLFTGKCLASSSDYINSVCERSLKDLSSSAEPQSVYPIFKRLGSELVLGLFLNVKAEETPEVFEEITQLCTLHWHGIISAPVNIKVPLWSSGFSTALEAKDKLMEIIKEKLELEQEGFVGCLRSLPLPDASCASQHLLLFISALIPKALASLLTSFTLALCGPGQEEVREQARQDPTYLDQVLLEVQRLWPPFIGGRRIANQDTTLEGYHIPKDSAAMYISHSVHRDPEVFHQPDEFKPERWSGRNAGQENLLCSLGNGPRNCIGTQLNHVFLKAACGYLLQHYDWTLSPCDQSLRYKWLPVSRPAEPPAVLFTPRHDQASRQSLGNARDTHACTCPHAEARKGTSD